jgi:quercetin dioxygenase-like cupin family protein
VAALASSPLRSSIPTKRKGLIVRLRWILAGAAAAMAISVGAAVATHVPEIDPATVPVGFLATHNDVSSFRIAPFARAVEKHRADVFVWHNRVAPGSALPWHTHPGPAIVTVVRGSLGIQREFQGECVTTWYTAGTGFVDAGRDVHRVLARDDGFDAYITFVVPSGTPNQTVLADPPDACS